MPRRTHRGPELVHLVAHEPPRLREVEAVGTHDRITGALDRSHVVDAERSQPGVGVGDEVPPRAFRREPERMHHAGARRALAPDVGEHHLVALDDGVLEVVEMRWRGAWVPALAPRRVVDDHRGRRRLRLRAERLGQRPHELPERGFELGRGRRRRPGHEEQRVGLGGVEPAEIGAGATDELPAAVAALA